MDEKTAELRDIFLDVSEEETVTESQSETRGSIAGDSGGIDAQLAEVIDQLREKFGFELSMSDSERCTVIERFYNGEDDEEIATALDVTVKTVFAARMELHLVRDEEPNVDEQTLEQIRESEGEPAEDVAMELDTTAEEIHRVRTILDTKERSRRASRRFRTAFEERLTDVDLTTQLAVDTHEDGLDDATDGAEVDVDF